MKNGVYIVYDSSGGTAGVDRKISGQICAMREAGLTVRIVHMGAKKVFGWRLFYRLPFTNINPYWTWNEAFDRCDFVYLRFPSYLNFALLHLLKKIKRKNPRAKIIMELHSGIHFKHLQSVPKMYPLLIKELVCMPFLKRTVDVMPALSDFDEVYRIYGIDTIPIKNGLDFSTIRVREAKKSKGSIDLVIVAMMVAAHGYERLIEGLYQYYLNGGERDIKLHFIGDGEELRKYKKLTTEYNLMGHIVFYGMKTLEEMQEIYNKCDIGVSAFALYKLGLSHSTLLKNKEYVAAGFPVIGAGAIDIAEVPGLKKYVLQFPNKEGAIEVEKIVRFYDNIYEGKSQNEVEEMIWEIRNAGEKHFDHQSAMESVIGYIESDDC